MPERANLGQLLNAPMAQPLGQRKQWILDGKPNPHGLRVVMGYYLPPWQRAAVWTRNQQIKFLESAWLGINLGTYTYNIVHDGGPFDDLLVDGQQRMGALEAYVTDEFPVFGWHWSEVTESDRRGFEMSTIFSCYRTETTDEAYLRNYYNLTNFGGTPHKDGEQA